MPDRSLQTNVYCKYRQNAERRGITWALTREQAVTYFEDDCFYCGCPPASVLRRTNRTTTITYFYNGIDRINNSVGYLPENTVTACSVCNRAKKAMSWQEWCDWIDRLSRRYEGINVHHSIKSRFTRNGKVA